MKSKNFLNILKPEKILSLMLLKILKKSTPKNSSFQKMRKRDTGKLMIELNQVMQEFTKEMVFLDEKPCHQKIL